MPIVLTLLDGVLWQGDPDCVLLRPKAYAQPVFNGVKASVAARISELQAASKA